MSSTGKRVTLQDIANKTGYSVNTVSHALRGKPDISSETIELIRSVANEMGYAGNQIASALRLGRTHIISVILGGMSNPFYGIMADCIQDAAQAKGYNVMIMCSRDDPELESHLVDEAITRCSDGIVLFPTSRSQQTIDRLKASKTPFVLMSRYLRDGDCDCVVCDEEKGAYLATKHLIDAGKRKLVYLSCNTIIYSSERRTEGFIHACNEAGIPEADRRFLIFNPEETYPTITDAWYQNLITPILQAKQDGFDGIFVFCDVEAWHIMDAINRTDLLTSHDFGIVSFDNIESALAFPVPLCSVSYSFREMAEKSVRLLRNRLHGDTSSPQTIICPVDFICRGSCNP